MTSRLAVIGFYLPRNKRDGIETLKQCAEWSQFVIDDFFGNLTYITGGFRQGSDTWVHTQKTRQVFWYTHLKTLAIKPGKKPTLN